MKRLVFRVAAAADVEEAYQWYERQRTGLGDDFLSAVQAAIEVITSNPEAHPVVHRDTRRILLRRFPYGLYYRVLDAEIVVVACFHARRNPRTWRSRH